MTFLLLLLTQIGCVDIVLFYPTHHPIASPGTGRLTVAIPSARTLDVVTLRHNVPTDAEPDVFVLVMDGIGGRAEETVVYGKNAVGDRPAEIWAVNYPGYGRSPGPTKIGRLPAAALAAFDGLKSRAGDKPIIIMGSSLGSAAALHVARHRSVTGLVLTNPPPLRELFIGRYGWWNLWLAAWPLAMQIPTDLDSLQNAAQVTCPAVFVLCGADAVVPAAYQQRVVDAYAGPKRIVILPNSDHVGVATGEAAADRDRAVGWMWSQAIKRASVEVPRSKANLPADRWSASTVAGQDLPITTESSRERSGN